MRPFPIGSVTAISIPGPGTSLSPSNQKLAETSCSYHPMDYTPFIRCSTALPRTLFCLFSLSFSIFFFCLLCCWDRQHEYKVRMMITANRSCHSIMCSHSDIQSNNYTLQNYQQSVNIIISVMILTALWLVVYISVTDVGSACSNRQVHICAQRAEMENII